MAVTAENPGATVVLTSERAAVLSKKWGADPRTIRRWLQAGAPFDDETAMRAWLSARPSIPARTNALLQVAPGARHVVPSTAKANQPRRIPKPVTEAGKLETGAAAALQRLEDQERTAFAELLALKGDPEATPEELDAADARWLRISESLRKYDLAIEESRRDAGHLVPRDEIVDYAKALIVDIFGTLGASLQASCPSLAGLETPAAVWETLGPVFNRSLREITANLATRPYNGRTAPDWLVQAVNQAIAAHF